MDKVRNMQKKSDGKGRRKVINRHGDLTPGPSHARNTSNRRVCDGVECSWREIKVGDLASCATIRDGHVHRLPLVSNIDTPVANRIGIWVDFVVTREVVKQVLRHGSNELGIVVGDSASAQASSIECSLTSLGASHETWLVATVTRRLSGLRLRRW